MNEKLNEVTLQINLCAGDILYAEQSVKKIVENHSQIKEVLLLVDTYKPQKTKLVNPELKFPEPEYSTKVKKIKEIAQSLLESGFATDIYYFENDKALINEMAKKYLHKSFTETHDTTGMAIMPYWAGIEKVKTRYILHYDADILPFQDKNYEWVSDALKFMEKQTEIIAAAPRNAPPTEETGNVPTFHQGRPIQSEEEYWINDWFGTRCFLMDKQKLTNYLPLLNGKLLAEAFARKFSKRNFPLSPEYVMFKKVGNLGGKRLILKTKQAWFIHPVNKSKDFVTLLPEIYKHLAKQDLPNEQRGWEDMKFDVWKEYLEQKKK